MDKCYAVYQGDKFLYMGTKQECAKHFGVKESTICFWATPAQYKRSRGEGRLAIIVEED